MIRNIESSFLNLSEIVYRRVSKVESDLLNNEEMNMLFKVPEPCLVVLKPPSFNLPEVADFLDKSINNFRLNVLVNKRIYVTREIVFDIYGDLMEVIRSGPNGEQFVENLVDSFTDGGPCVAMIVYGDDCYSRMVKTKKLIREKWSAGGAKNIMHCSDNVADAIREISAFIH